MSDSQHFLQPRYGFSLVFLSEYLLQSNLEYGQASKRPPGWANTVFDFFRLRSLPSLSSSSSFASSSSGGTGRGRGRCLLRGRLDPFPLAARPLVLRLVPV